MYVRCQMDSSRAEHWIRSLTCFPFVGQGKQLVATNREASRPNAPIRMHAMPRRRVQRLRRLRGCRRPSAGFPCAPTPCVGVFASSCAPVSPVSPSSRRSLREWVEATRRHDDEVRDISLVSSADSTRVHFSSRCWWRRETVILVSEYEYEGRRPSSTVVDRDRVRRKKTPDKIFSFPRPRHSHTLPQRGATSTSAPVYRLYTYRVAAAWTVAWRRVVVVSEDGFEPGVLPR